MVFQLKVRPRAPEKNGIALSGLDLDANVVVARSPVRDGTVAICGGEVRGLLVSKLSGGVYRQTSLRSLMSHSPNTTSSCLNIPVSHHPPAHPLTLFALPLKDRLAALLDVREEQQEGCDALAWLLAEIFLLQPADGTELEFRRAGN